MDEHLVAVERAHDGQREAGHGEHQVHEVPQAEEHHQQVEDALHPLAGEHQHRHEVEDQTNQGDAQAAGAVEPVLQAGKKNDFMGKRQFLDQERTLFQKKRTMNVYTWV